MRDVNRLFHYNEKPSDPFSHLMLDLGCVSGQSNPPINYCNSSIPTFSSLLNKHGHLNCGSYRSTNLNLRSPSTPLSVRAYFQEEELFTLSLNPLLVPYGIFFMNLPRFESTKYDLSYICISIKFSGIYGESIAKLHLPKCSSNILVQQRIILPNLCWE